MSGLIVFNKIEWEDNLAFIYKCVFFFFFKMAQLYAVGMIVTYYTYQLPSSLLGNEDKFLVVLGRYTWENVYQFNGLRI